MSREKRIGSYSATEAQNNFGRVLSEVAERETVVITRYDRPTAVVLSAKRYRELTGDDDALLADLEREFEELLAAMDSPAARKAVDSLFEMDSEELGAAAVSAAERR